jgi:hypothetical protein
MTAPDPTANIRNKRRRDKLKSAGMVPITKWVPADKADQVKQAIADIITPEESEK